MRTPAAGGDAGETLVELLITLVILGVGVVALLGGLFVTVQTSALHRNQVVAQNVLRGWAEQIGAEEYTHCATPDSFSPPTLPSGFSGTVVAVQYWDGTSFTDSCDPGDTGIQKVSLRITVSKNPFPGITQSVDVVVRKPCESSC